VSRYYEANGLEFSLVVEDIKAGKVKGIRWYKAENQTEESVSITDGECVAWLMPGCEFITGCGLKAYGANNESNILTLLSNHYGRKFIGEDDLGVLVV